MKTLPVTVYYIHERMRQRHDRMSKPTHLLSMTYNLFVLMNIFPIISFKLKWNNNLFTSQRYIFYPFLVQTQRNALDAQQ